MALAGQPDPGRPPSTWQWAAFAVLFGLLVYEAHGLREVLRFNELLRSGDYHRAAELSLPQASFARAYARGREAASGGGATGAAGDTFESALDAYRASSASAPAGISGAVTFNMANLYLRQGVALNASGDDDLGIALVELAKENYRDLLRKNSGDWSAKYNLELAVLLFPEPPELDPTEQGMPERSTRATASAPLHKELP